MRERALEAIMPTRVGAYMDLSADTAWCIPFAKRQVEQLFRHPERIEIESIRVVEAKEAA